MKSMRLTLTILAVLALALAWAGPALADLHWTCFGQPGTGRVCGQLGHATTDPLKTCIYPISGNAPDVGTFPCAKYRHFVGMDKRAMFRPDPLSPFSNRTNFGQELGVGSGGGSAAAPEAAEATGVSWVQEIETP